MHEKTLYPKREDRSRRDIGATRKKQNGLIIIVKRNIIKTNEILLTEEMRRK